ncbi:MAG: ABC transporter ATP-binding protein/permease, partial [Syntrophales bacterium]|nr:ABC transporter ATP-binding protein/permease [Syntrophales bacterium]
HTAIDAMPAVARAGVLFLGAYWVITDHWSLGSLFAYQAYLGYVFGPARVLATANLQMQAAMASVDRVANLFDVIPEPGVGEGIPVEKLRGEITLRGVSFAYDPARPILERVTFSIRAGERAAITGVSGVGKTTLISLLLQFYRPTGGDILYDGRPASDFDPTSLRLRLGYVSQQHMLLSGSIAENIAYGTPGASDAEIAQAAVTAGIHDFIAGLPEGYRTPIGERGILLSEGQKQRLCIARALLKSPDVILLDEPAAALDGQTAQTLLASLGPALAGRTVIVISNDEEWLEACDRVLYIEDRRLSAVGAHAELMGSNEAYAALVRGAP